MPSMQIARGDDTSNEVELSTGAKYFRHKDIISKYIIFKDIVIRVAENDIVTFTCIVEQRRKFYTYTRNRTSWTGPKLELVLFDHGRVPIGGIFHMPKVNFLCGKKSRRIYEEKKIAGAFKSAESSFFSFSDYRVWFC